MIARDIEHARAITLLLEEEGDRVDLVHSQDSEAAARLSGFQTGQADWLVSIDMCAEGFDASRIRVVAYLTTVVTRSRFVQGITRAVRMCGERANLESIPREPPMCLLQQTLLMQYARSWSLSEPYRIAVPAVADDQDPTENGGSWRGPSLPMEAVEDGAGRGDPHENSGITLDFCSVENICAPKKMRRLTNSGLMTTHQQSTWSTSGRQTWMQLLNVASALPPAGHPPGSPCSTALSAMKTVMR